VRPRTQVRRPRESAESASYQKHWIPAFAGMTNTGVMPAQFEELEQ
jgi:hypothetical protein